MAKKKSRKKIIKQTSSCKKGSKRVETFEQKQKRKKNDVLRKRRSKVKESFQHKRARQDKDKKGARTLRAKKKQYNNDRFFMEAFNYNPSIDYSFIPEVDIGKLNFLCPYCGAYKFEEEVPGMCCSNGKVELQLLEVPPEPLMEYISGETEISRHFLNNVSKYNACVNMTSFGVTKKCNNGFMPTFKIQGQIYHTIGSLLPMNEGSEKFLQVYFLGNESSEVNKRLENTFGLNREILSNIQNLLHKHNKLVQIFKYALDHMPTDEYQLVMKADKIPTNIHKKRLNVPTTNEVAIVMVGDECNSRDIIVRRRDESLRRVNETHRSYDALQYPLMFWQGEDGYHFGIQQSNTNSTPKKVI